MQHDLAKIRENAEKDIRSAGTLDRIEELRIQFLGRNGALTAVLRSLKDIVEKERPKVGEEANRLRMHVEHLLQTRGEELKKTDQESVLKKEWIDVTRPGIRTGKGHLHPLTHMLREIEAIFGSMGFETVEGPEAETEHYNFDALNIPANHPARDMWDTFWLQGSQKEIRNTNIEIRNKSKIKNRKSERLLLRTHTSPVQVRYMETHNPPIRIIVPGRVYRFEATDASHDIQFYQVEGLVVDRTVSIANFKDVIGEFFSRLFKADVTVRLRPSYFPFTEPSFEVDISCTYCGQKGCSICKKTGWLELAGAGMVHPNVFKATGYNPKDLQGFAFGMGLDRIAMMKYKIPDIRLFHSGDLRFLKQF